MFACTYIYMYVWVYTGEVNAKRIREKYLQAVLRQDIAFFDNVGAGEVATRIQTDTRKFFSSSSIAYRPAQPWDIDLVQQGISEKVALVVNFLAAFIVGFVLAYIRSWRLALALSSILPCIAITGGIMNKMVSRSMQYVSTFLKQSLDVMLITQLHRASLKHVADGGSLAEEVISTVRTAQAFGTQRILSDLYDGHTGKAYVLDMKAAAWNGGGLAIFFFIIYSAYALGMSSRVRSLALILI